MASDAVNDPSSTAVLPVLPIKRSVLFPGVTMPLGIGRPRSVAAIEAALASEEKTILVVAQRDAATAEPRLEDLHAVGTWRTSFSQIARR